ncbi:MAG: copper resistance protein B [Hyphomonas sp.]|nr:copper resistance protein B [Hyphomonas sp.]MCA8903419.1 copper resistance protein B [Hyphomonas sp.]
MRKFCFTALASISLCLPALAQAHSGHGTSGGDRPWSQADAWFDPAEMDAVRQHMQAHHGATPLAMFMLNRGEVQFADDKESGVWDADFWYGGDLNKVWLKTEGEYDFDAGKVEGAEVQLLWSRAVSRYFDLQTGLRYDFEPDGIAHAVLGFQGLAPYWFEVDGAAYLSEEGDLTADFEAEYELRLTQRLFLQPRIEAAFSAADIPERNLGSGLTNLQAGLRLRYEIRREFAPYVGVEQHSALGGTADRMEAAGGDPDQTWFVVGIRSWY